MDAAFAMAFTRATFLKMQSFAGTTGLMFIQTAAQKNAAGMGRPASMRLFFTPE